MILARVVPPFSAAETSVEASEALAARENLEEIASKLRRAETSVEVAVLPGNTAAQIVDAAAAYGAEPDRYVHPRPLRHWPLAVR